MFIEADAILLLHARLTQVMDGLGKPWEIIYVNDGSRDTTLTVVESLRTHDPRVAVANLSRNFGKEIARGSHARQSRLGTMTLTLTTGRSGIYRTPRGRAHARLLRMPLRPLCASDLTRYALQCAKSGVAATRPVHAARSPHRRRAP
jgi:hypothetical protein